MKENNTTTNKEEKKEKKPISFVMLLIKSSFLAILFTLVMLSFTAAGIGFYAYRQFDKFADTANLSKSEIIETIKKGYYQEITQTNNHKNFLILGVDALENRGQETLLTDTIMIGSLNLENADVNLISIPRDLWHEEYQTKINALLYYGNEKNPSNPTEFPKNVISELTNIPIHHTIIISLGQLESLIDTLGGVEVEIESSFTDDMFPRTDIDVTVETDPKKLYESITFEKGAETMSGERALKYIRSRHSNNQEGNDIARGKRQQYVIEAIIKKILDVKSMAKSPDTVGSLYRFYLDNFDQSLSIEEMVALGKKLYPVKDQLKISGHSLSEAKPPVDSTGAIFHPDPRQYQNQWVYSIFNKEVFLKEISDKLTL